MYYHKSWHHGFADFKHLKEDEEVRFTVCPACQMIQENKFEGKVIIENVPAEYKDELLSNIKNTGQKEYERDPLDRIINVKAQMTNGKFAYNAEVTTTENQLARNIARQVERSFRGARGEIRWSKEESSAVIIVKFNKD